jgi:glutamate synthase (NADPH/NADH) large chain
MADDDLKADLASRYPYEQWLKRTQVQVGDLPLPKKIARKKTNVALLDLQQAFGYTQESLKFLMAPMAHTGQEAVGSMGNDTPVSVLSNRPKLLHTYFKQNFAQVTNPPIDSIREELVMSLVSFIGPRPNLLDLEGTAKIKRLEVYQPILTNEDLERIRQIGLVKDNQFSSVTIDITYQAEKSAAGMSAALDVVCAEAEEAVRSKEYNIVILLTARRGSTAFRSRRCSQPPPCTTPIKQGLRTGRPGGGDGRGARGAPVLRAGGLRREAVNPYLVSIRSSSSA